MTDSRRESAHNRLDELLDAARSDVLETDRAQNVRAALTPIMTPSSHPPPPVGGGETAGAGAEAGATAAAGLATTSSVKIGGAVLLAAGIAVTSAVMMTSKQRAPGSPSSQALAPSAAQEPLPLHTAPDNTPPPVPAFEAADDAERATDEPRKPRRRARPVDRPSTRARHVASPLQKSPPAEVQVQQEKEYALLDRARARLVGAPAASLALARQHARDFEEGLLAQEREVIAIEALARLGRFDQARKRARAFHETYPFSAQRERISFALSLENGARR